MTVGQKVSVSILISVLLFAGFAVVSFSGLFNLIESRFYNPVVTGNANKLLEETTEAVKLYHLANIERFRAVLARDAVRRSFLPNQSSDDIFNRSNAFGKLQEDLPGLVGVRFLDITGRKIHFSTYPADIKSKDDISIIYRNYGDLASDEGFDTIKAGEKTEFIYTQNPGKGNFLYSFPFFDSYQVYRGTAVFSVSAQDLVSTLTKKSILKIGDDFSVAGSLGVVFKAPRAGQSLLIDKVVETWSLPDPTGALPVSSTDSGESWVLFTSDTGGFGYIGLIMPQAYFAFPFAMKLILLSSFFVTIYLLIFLAFNIRQDSLVVLRDKVKRFQINFLEEYLERKGEIDFERWRNELEGRKAEVRKGIRNSIRGIGPKKSGEVDALIDKSWDEILRVLGTKVEDKSERIDVKELEEMLKNVLKSGTFVLPGATVRTESQPALPSGRTGALPSAREIPSKTLLERKAPVEETEELEELEELEEAETVGELEELEELEEADAGESAVAVEELEELEEAEAVETVETVEELEEAEEPEGGLELAEAAPPSLPEVPAAIFDAEDVSALPESLSIELVEVSGSAASQKSAEPPSEAPRPAEAEHSRLEPIEDWMDSIQAGANFAEDLQKPRITIEGLGIVKEARTLEPEPVAAPEDEIDYELLIGSLDLSSLEQLDEESVHEPIFESETDLGPAPRSERAAKPIPEAPPAEPIDMHQAFTPYVPFFARKFQDFHSYRIRASSGANPQEDVEELEGADEEKALPKAKSAPEGEKNAPAVNWADLRDKKADTPPSVILDSDGLPRVNVQEKPGGSEKNAEFETLVESVLDFEESTLAK